MTGFGDGNGEAGVGRDIEVRIRRKVVNVGGVVENVAA